MRGPREAIDLPDGSALAILRLARPIAAAPGDRFALRRPSPGSTAGGGVVLDPLPPRGVSRRRLTADRAAARRRGPGRVDPAARSTCTARSQTGGGWQLAPDVEAALRARCGAARPRPPRGRALVAGPAVDGAPGGHRDLAARRRVTLGRVAADAVARAVVDRALADGLRRP